MKYTVEQAGPGFEGFHHEEFWYNIVVETNGGVKIAGQVSLPLAQLLRPFLEKHNARTARRMA